MFDQIFSRNQQRQHSVPVFSNRWSAAAFVAVLICITQLSFSRAAEIRQYTFVDELPAYHFINGWGPDIRAKLKGVFEVSVDHQLGVGTLLSIEARLSEPESYIRANAEWLPLKEGDYFYGHFQDGDFFPSYYDVDDQPPLGGLLTPAEYRPLGAFSLTVEQLKEIIGPPNQEFSDPVENWWLNRIGFEFAPADTWLLASDHTQLPTGSYKNFNYSIYFDGDEARLSYFSHWIDATPNILAARAVWNKVPEPNGIQVACCALLFSSQGFRCFRRMLRFA